MERVKQIQCTHIKSTAHWLSSRKIQELKTLYKASPEDAIREFGGIVISDYLPALCKDDVNKCFAAPRVITSAPPPYVFTCCDPTGGGPSMLSIASGYFNNAGDVVVRKIVYCPTKRHYFVFLLYFPKYIFSVHVTTACTISTILGSPNACFMVASIMGVNTSMK